MTSRSRPPGHQTLWHGELGLAGSGHTTPPKKRCLWLSPGKEMLISQLGGTATTSHLWFVPLISPTNPPVCTLSFPISGSSPHRAPFHFTRHGGLDPNQAFFERRFSPKWKCVEFFLKA